MATIHLYTSALSQTPHPLTHTCSVPCVIVSSRTHIALKDGRLNTPRVSHQAIFAVASPGVSRTVGAIPAPRVTPGGVEVAETFHAVRELSAIRWVDGEGVGTRLAARACTRTGARARFHVVYRRQRCGCQVGGVSGGIVQGGVV